MKQLLAPLVIAALATPLAAQTIDVNQPSDTTCMAGFGQVDLAQSFIPTTNNCSGAGIFMRAATGSAETLTISLYSGGLPGTGTLIASGTGLASPGAYFDVFWPAVTVIPGNTYYLDFSPTASMCFAGDTANPYAGGNVFANSGYGAFLTFDYTFRTYFNSGPVLTLNGVCPSLGIDVRGATPFGSVAFLTGPVNASFVVGGGPCAGITLGVSPPTLQTIQTADVNGLVSMFVTLPPGACGLYLQTVDISTCAPSNVVQLL